MNIENFGKGAIKDPKPDPRNYLIENIFGAGESFDWNKGFDIEEKLGMKLKVENQNGSLSCVGQSVSKYLEVLNIIEEGKFIDLSAKDIYSRIFQPQGGAMIIDAFKLAIKRGVSKEITNPSYKNGLPPDESFMREVLSGNDEEAYIYGAKSYATTTHNDIDFIAQMIRDNNGVVSGFIGDNQGWKETDIKPPISRDWGHATFLGKAKMRNDKKMVALLNSWGEGVGEKGWQWFDVSYVGDFMFNIFTLIDKVNQPNNKNMQYVITPDNNQWLIDYTLKVALPIANESELNNLKASNTELALLLKNPPVAMPSLDGYSIYRGATEKGWKEFLNL